MFPPRHIVAAAEDSLDVADIRYCNDFCLSWIVVKFMYIRLSLSFNLLLPRIVVPHVCVCVSEGNQSAALSGTSRGHQFTKEVVTNSAII